MKIKVFWDTKTPFNESLDYFTKSFVRNDTVYIFGEMIGELGYGFELLLFRDSCIVASFAISDGKYINTISQTATQYRSYHCLALVKR